MRQVKKHRNRLQERCNPETLEELAYAEFNRVSVKQGNKPIQWWGRRNR